MKPSALSFISFFQTSKCRRKGLLFFIPLFGLCFSLKAQDLADENIIITKNRGPKVEIHLKNDKEIHNLLVLITDSAGRTLFLDNKYRFKGDYDHTVDLSGEKKGEYKIRIIRDEKHFNKNLKVD